MKAAALFLLSVAAVAPARAQHAGHAMPMDATPPAHAQPAPAVEPHAAPGGAAAAAPAPAPEDAIPPAALTGPEHAADTVFDQSRMRKARAALRDDQGGIEAYKVMLDRFEARIRDGRDGYLWDANAWWGGDIDKLWIKSEGEGSFGGKLDAAELQALWSRAITPWFDLQAGLRYDARPEPERVHAVLGIQGLAPYLVELDAAAFLSHKGDLTARVEAEYDLLITQRLILQPRAEINLSAQDVRELGIGDGIADIELGARLRYEFAREFAPYVGIGWTRKLFQTADFARAEGEEVDELALLLGLRLWF